MKTIPSTIYNKAYYTEVCLGSSEFNKTNGKTLAPEVKMLLREINIKKTDVVLDIGCGRGDITIHIGTKAKMSIGIDYSKDGISLAKKAKSSFPQEVQKKIKFFEMNATQLKFTDNYFDKVVAIDVLEHLNKQEVKRMMKEVKRVLKPNGVFFAHTGTNKILHEYTYPLYIRPFNMVIRFIDHVLLSKTYDPLPKDPRTDAEHAQHINEPTYFYLKDLFQNYKFAGTIKTRVGYIKDSRTTKHLLYNFISVFYPLSKHFPLNILFGWAFICTMKNIKPASNA